MINVTGPDYDQWIFIRQRLTAYRISSIYQQIQQYLFQLSGTTADYILGEMQTALAWRSKLRRVRLIPHESPSVNYGFDVTPARLITGLITERGICEARESDILRLFPEREMG